jgi:hypothetical protein
VVVVDALELRIDPSLNKADTASFRAGKECGIELFARYAAWLRFAGGGHQRSQILTPVTDHDTSCLDRLAICKNIAKSEPLCDSYGGMH